MLGFLVTRSVLKIRFFPVFAGNREGKATLSKECCFSHLSGFLVQEFGNFFQDSNLMLAQCCLDLQHELSAKTSKVQKLINHRRLIFASFPENDLVSHL